MSDTFVIPAQFSDNVLAEIAEFGFVKQVVPRSGELWPFVYGGAPGTLSVEGLLGGSDGRRLLLTGNGNQFHIYIQWERPSALREAQLCTWMGEPLAHRAITNEPEVDRHFTISGASQAAADIAATWVREHALEALRQLCPVYDFSLVGHYLRWYELDRDQTPDYERHLNASLIHRLIDLARALEGKPTVVR